MMATRENFNAAAQLKQLTLLGGMLLVVFIASFVWLNQIAPANGEGFLALAPYWVFPYLVVVSGYAGFFSARLAKSRGQNVWLWGLAGFALTLLCTLRMPSLLAPLFPYPSPEIFAGPALFAFLAPVLALLLVSGFMSLRSKAAA